MWTTVLRANGPHRPVVGVTLRTQPVALFELECGAVHVVARLPVGIVVVAADWASPVPLRPLL